MAEKKIPSQVELEDNFWKAHDAVKAKGPDAENAPKTKISHYVSAGRSAYPVRVAAPET